MTDATASDPEQDRRPVDSRPAPDARLQVREPDVAISAGESEPGPVSVVLRSPDVVLLAVAVLPALAYGPELGFCFGAGGWVLQRFLAVFDRRWIGNVADPIKQLAVNLFESFGRIWLLAGVIVLAAVIGERQDGLAAAVTILIAYSVAFVARLISRARPPKAAK
jgi:hypothetical protein